MVSFQCARLLSRYFVVVCLICLFVGTSAATPLEDGYVAYENRDYEKARRLWLPLASQGNAYAQSALGTMHFFGHGVPKDYAEAVRWFRMAAEGGNTHAQNYLGAMYVDGLGVTRDLVEAHRWFSIAAELGYAAAAKNRKAISKRMTPPEIAEAKMRARAWLDNTPGSTSPKRNECVEAYAKAGPGTWSPLKKPKKSYTRESRRILSICHKMAESGDSASQRTLGEMYRSGLRVKGDYTEAIKWYRKAAKQGDLDSMYNLGVIYTVPRRNLVKAVKWYRKAADRGYVPAQHGLGERYYYGSGGVSKDLVKAHALFNIADMQGYKYGAKRRDKITKKITPEELSEAQQLAGECSEKNYKNCGF